MIYEWKRLMFPVDLSTLRWSHSPEIPMVRRVQQSVSMEIGLLESNTEIQQLWNRNLIVYVVLYVLYLICHSSNCLLKSFATTFFIFYASINVELLQLLNIFYAKQGTCQLYTTA